MLTDDTDIARNFTVPTNQMSAAAGSARPDFPKLFMTGFSSAVCVFRI